ncbi:MAG TPA: hypothetical protein VH350_12865 [Candidatus Sulfotelmatobacter sp.]|jgi:hypothetical protein|nr:hypothetical protein [Candidatus Sulfotelmatobacter sp.]
MVILISWKPVALLLGPLSALILVSYFGSALMRGKDPFAVSHPELAASGRASCRDVFNDGAPFNGCAPAIFIPVA